MPDRLTARCTSASNCLVAEVDDAGTVWLYSTRRTGVRIAVDADEWASRPAELGGPAGADLKRAGLAALAPGWESPAALQAAYSEILALCETAESERDQARRDAASWEDWGRGWKTQAEANQVERDKAWADLDAVKAERDRRSDELKRAQQVLGHVRRAVLVADAEDATDWQRGYRDCSRRALEALGSAP